jgi:hypothetical protein
LNNVIPLFDEMSNGIRSSEKEREGLLRRVHLISALLHTSPKRIKGKKKEGQSERGQETNRESTYPKWKAENKEKQGDCEGMRCFGVCKHPAMTRATQMGSNKRETGTNREGDRERRIFLYVGVFWSL